MVAEVKKSVPPDGRTQEIEVWYESEKGFRNDGCPSHGALH